LGHKINSTVLVAPPTMEKSADTALIGEERYQDVPCGSTKTRRFHQLRSMSELAMFSTAIAIH